MYQSAIGKDIERKSEEEQQKKAKRSLQDDQIMRMMFPQRYQEEIQKRNSSVDSTLI